MPGTGHSHRYKGSISNRNTKSAFQVLAPWNAKKNGEKNQVAVSTGGDNLNFKLMGAKMMSNYHKDGDNFILDCSLTVLGNKIVDGSAIIHGNVEIDGTLEVKEKATFEKDVDICGNLRVWGKVTDLSDVDICGNLNANTGTFQGKLTNLDIHDGSGAGGIVTKYLTVTDNAYINTGDILHLVDVCDNILTLGNHNAATEEEVRGIVAKYIHANTDSSNVAFFGMDPSFNGGLVDDIHGQFVFILDVSENIGTIPADQIGGTLGRAAFGTLDICGSYLYGGGDPGTGLPTQNVSDQANCQMHLVGKTIIACQTPAGGTCESAQLDISGGIDVDGDICGNGMNFAINYANVDISGATSVDISGGITTLDASTALNIGPVGTTIAIGNSSATVDISGLTVDISGGTVKVTSTTGDVELIGAHDATMQSIANDVVILAAQNFEATGSTNVLVTASTGFVNVTGAGGVNIAAAAAGINIGGGATTVDISGATSVDISGGTTTLDATTALNIGPISQNIAIGNSSATVDISGSTVDISGGTSVKLSDGSGANINIASGLIHLDVNSTILGQTLGQIKLTDGSGAYIDMSGGKIDISGDHVTITGGPTSISLKSQTINIGEAGGTVDIKGNVKVDAAVTFVVKDISATNIDVSGALTVNGGTIDMSGTNTAVGYQALQDNTDGSNNVAVGYRALNQNVDGSKNTALGHEAGLGQSISGHLQISNTINIGYDTSCNASNTACIGNVDISCVYLGSINGNAKLDCSGIVSSGLVETTDISCGSIYADGVPGTSGQVLSSTGTGIEWVEGTTVGSHWNVDSDGIHNTSGENVGIGKDSSNNVALDVSGNMAINGTINTLTVGFGSGDISNNTVVGYQALQSNTTGTNNVATGYQALYLNASGVGNTATGYQALQDNGDNGNYNTATGYQALQDNSGAGYGNVATGAFALYKNAGNHSYNTATGYQALQDNSGGYNTAIGYIAGKGQTDISNTINVGYDTSCNASKTACIGNADISCVYFGSINGNAKLDCSGIVSSGDAIINTLTVGLGGGNNATNTATGNHALFSNSSGMNNTAIGYQALNLNTTGNYNVAIGFGALVTNVDASANVAIGFDALRTCTSSGNTATGYQAMLANTDGVLNVANGYQAMLGNSGGTGNTAIGYQALKDNTTGFKNVALGYGAGNNQENSISKNTINIGYDTSCNARDTACIGNADISCVYLGSINGNAKLDCSGIVSSGLVETTDISCSSIYATKIGTISDDLDLDAKNLSLATTETALISGNHGVTIEATNLNGVDIFSATSVKLSDGSGAHINISDGNIDISGSAGGDVEIICGTGNLAIPSLNGLSYSNINTGSAVAPIYAVNTNTATAGKITLGVDGVGTGVGVQIPGNTYLVCDMSNSIINSSSVVLSSINCGGDNSEYLSLSGGGFNNAKYQFIIANNGTLEYDSSATTNGVHLEISFLVIKPTF